ncbi:MAG: DUF1343 domain-containing protein [Calditrichaeota bacterium]|nr:MAG: DUF1343 domain-containing protein [Calditrichota bacterium]MBL1204817.1 DUF1343 domain-containing protein [Calditrichota bacterium]NOG44646.1 DUF1343 domain-containing protein [Calditrichota bacterium]
MQVRIIKWICFFLLISLLSTSAQTVKTGLDRVGSYYHLFEGKRLGIVTNHTALNAKGQHITDVFKDMKNVTVAALFGPEHGVRGNAADGQKIESETEAEIPVYSLYGKTKKPNSEMLKNVDLLVFDIQDIGARFYTYVWTMSYVMDAAEENNIPLVVLDRPNPITCKIVEGNCADTSTFVGRFPIPVRHGMTIGELAKLFKGESWISSNLDLTIVPLQNWKREYWFDQTELTFTAPSPNMPNLETATVYPGMCLLEGTNLSEGRGTDKPFIIFGAPWIDSKNLRNHLESLQFDGVSFTDTTFIPVTIPGKAVRPKFENKKCNGLKVIVDDREKYKSYQTGVFLINALYQLYPGQLEFKRKHFDRLAGSSKIRRAILGGSSKEELKTLISLGLDSFKQKREKNLLY